jgi:microcin C transport system ATP-binding protein
VADAVADPAPRRRPWAVVGESGSGKTTLGMSLLRLASGAVGGEVRLGEDRLDTMSSTDLRRARRRMQVVFQDPFNSLSPRMTVGAIVGRGTCPASPRTRNAGQRRQAIVSVLHEVGLERVDARALSARVLRRPASAHRDRAGAGGAA